MTDIVSLLPETAGDAYRVERAPVQDRRPLRRAAQGQGG
jgi:hypothetical protein